MDIHTELEGKKSVQVGTQYEVRTGRGGRIEVRSTRVIGDPSADLEYLLALKIAQAKGNPISENH